MSTATRPEVLHQPIADLERVLTPALLIYPEIVDANIAATLRVLGGRAGRWRPHVKTAKLASTMRQCVNHGITHFKCATTLELLTACAAGASDVLVAFACSGTKAMRVREIADAYPDVAISALIENQAQLGDWRDQRIGLFIDVNPGMNRTGIDQWNVEAVLHLAQQIIKSGLPFRGLHYYDGQHSQQDLQQRNQLAEAGYRQLMVLVEALRTQQIPVPEIVTSGTPTFAAAVAFAAFENPASVHRVSPGTVVYNDLTSLSQLPEVYGYQAAAMVATTVISHPAPDVITCDAGHKTLSVDAGVPNCSVLGHPGLEPLRPSEEHLPIRVMPGAYRPKIGEILRLIPRHVCPTVNNFDQALLIHNDRITEVAPVTARGRENPVWNGEDFPAKTVRA
jgi:D-serine deaminase-like pyridoxal phosphate-dependent protein